VFLQLVCVREDVIHVLCMFNIFVKSMRQKDTVVSIQNLNFENEATEIFFQEPDGRYCTRS
jgi:hypothetical protein